MYWKKVVQIKDYITTDLQKQEGTLCTGFIWEGTGGGFLSARYWTQFNRPFIAHNLSLEQSLSSEANSSSRQFRNYPHFMETEVHYRDHNSPPNALIQGLSVIISWLQRVSNRPVRILVTMKNELHFRLFLYTFQWHILETWYGSSASSCLSMFRSRQVTMFAVQLTSIDNGEWSRTKQTLRNAACHFNTWDTPIFYPEGCGERVQTSSEVCLLFLGQIHPAYTHSTRVHRCLSIWNTVLRKLQQIITFRNHILCNRLQN